MDIDASLVEIHSENKEQAAPTYKGGYGFHPMFCFADQTGETLSALLRPGNAGANTVADHVSVLDGAIAQLPAAIAAGHHDGDDSVLVERAVVVRADSAGCTEGFLVGLSGAQRRLLRLGPDRTPRSPRPSSMPSGSRRCGFPPSPKTARRRRELRGRAHLSLIDDAKLPAGTRLIVRREPLHPGAQRSLFPSLDYRYWGFYTDQDGDPRDLDVTMRAHAHVEQHIERLKDSGLTRFPFTSFEANATWMMVVALAADLVRWFQLLCFDGTWNDARPKALRWGIFHAPGRLVRRARQRIVRIIDGWPTTEVLLEAYRRIALIT